METIINRIMYAIKSSLKNEIHSIYFIKRDDLSFCTLHNAKIFQFFIIINENVDIESLRLLSKNLLKTREELKREGREVDFIYGEDTLSFYTHLADKADAISGITLWCRDVINHLLLSSDYAIMLKNLSYHGELLFGNRIISEWKIPRINPWHCVFSFYDSLTRYTTYLYELYINRDIEREYPLFNCCGLASVLQSIKNILLIKNVYVQEPNEIYKKFCEYFPNYDEKNTLRHLIRTTKSQITRSKRVYERSLFLLNHLTEYLLSGWCYAGR